MTLREIAMHCKIKQSEREADKYKQQSDLYESVLTGTVTEFIVPKSWTKIRQGMFYSCVKLTNITIKKKKKTIEVSAFSFCSGLKSVDISTGVLEIKNNAFYSCSALTDITIPSVVTTVSATAFTGCSNLTNVTLGNGFNANTLNLSSSTKYSVDTIVAMLTALADRSNQSAYKLTLGATNLAKLSDEQKAIATDKNWTLA